MPIQNFTFRKQNKYGHNKQPNNTGFIEVKVQPYTIYHKKRYRVSNISISVSGKKRKHCTIYWPEFPLSPPKSNKRFGLSVRTYTTLLCQTLEINYSYIIF